MNINLKIAIAESSAIIRSGLEAQLRKLTGFHFQIVEIDNSERLYEAIRLNKPEILIISPAMMRGEALHQLREDTGNLSMKCMALLYTLTDKNQLRYYDEQISIYDTPEELKQKLEQFCQQETEDDKEDEEQQLLSVREKEIVVCVVKGMTNREIADLLYLSTHTIITHRRNIARKLQIHSASGLTVYAIVNKLVELSDIGKL
ncbi:MAG: LuxR C-terminal-related transcriptional regulator [Tannerellaceae bacterium]|jgi:DNA-binding NarL/FixJ family response regulator|nr:LuxR C-terminal-related transcriptional regulator [Tannerellaceae bacterium]